MKKSVEEQLSLRLRSILDPLPPGKIEDSEELLDLLSCLEYWLPAVLSEVFPHWKNESLDGLFATVSRKIAVGEAELVGMCTLMHDQCVTPFHVRLRVCAESDEIEWVEFKVGESGEGKGGMLRMPYDKMTKLLFALPDRLESVDWVFKVTFGSH